MIGKSGKSGILICGPHAPSLGTHFTCFTGTKVQILTQKCYAARGPPALLYFAEPLLIATHKA
jgi:hypothetical protein